jgi:RNA polymerase sigma factor (sigma-70 family)
MTGAERPEGGAGGAKTSEWLSLLILPALGSLGLGVLLPLWVLAVVFSTLLSGVWCDHRLKQIGLYSQDFLGMAGLVSAVLVLGGLGACAWVSLQESFRKGSEPPKGGPGGWLLRHPWWALCVGLMVANAVFLSEPVRHRLAAASVLLAQGSWFILTAAWLAWRMAWGCLRLGWRLSRASAFMAGLVVAAGLFTAASWSLFFRTAEEWGRSASASLKRGTRDGARPGGNWSKADLGSLLSGGSPPSAVPALFEREPRGEVLLTPVYLGNPGEGAFGDVLFEPSARQEAPDGFADCVLGLSERLRGEATLLARRYVDSFEAQDVVQDVLLRVCLRGRSPSSAPGYFIRSIENRAMEWRRRAKRSCSLMELPETGCALHPEEEYLREEQSRAISKALCTLPEEEQEAVRLRFVEHEDYAGIAQRQGWSQTNARQRVSRAIKKLRAAFQEKCLP